MKRDFLKILIFTALVVGAVNVYTPAVCARDRSGAQVVANAAAFVRSSRKIEFKLSGMTGKRSYSQRGWMIANNKKCYLNILGSAQYDYEGSILTVYNVKSNEYYIQKYNPGSDDPSANPFSLFIDKHAGIFSAPVQAKTSDGEIAVMVTATFPGNRYCKAVNIYVTGSGDNTILKEIVIFSKRGEKIVTTITRYSAPDNSLLVRVSVNPKDNPRSKVTDLR